MKEFPIRRHPRLKEYNYNCAGAYFVTCCVKDGHEMLGKVVAGHDVLSTPQVQLSKYGVIADKYINNINCLHKGVFVDKYVIMPNHIHMILVVEQDKDGAMRASRPTDAVVPSIMRSLKALITKEIGFSIWQNTYHDHIIRDETEYQRIWKYIDENPIKWKEDRYFVELL